MIRFDGDRNPARPRAPAEAFPSDGDAGDATGACVSLEGRGSRKVRQSVSRLRAAGYTATAINLSDVDEAAVAELEQVSRLWRGGSLERGFSMAMDSLGSGYEADSVVIVARDADGRIRGFLHFVPSRLGLRLERQGERGAPRRRRDGRRAERVPDELVPALRGVAIPV
ncbi:MAG: DUF2156 domain-containing protein [Actinobacteria bacterium]|nr:MAG: DUF2156 domain-containing protein [Actinomycetota bacterium]